MVQTILADFQNLFENKNIPFLIIDQNYKIKKTSKNFCELLGDGFENFSEGLLLSDVFSAECLFVEKPLTQIIIDLNKDFQNVQLCLSKDKSRIFYVQIYRFLDENQTSFLLAFDEIDFNSREFGMDINNLNRMRLIVEHIPFGLFVKDVRSNFSYIVWNKKNEDIYGMDANQVIGKTDFEVFDQETASQYREVDNNIVRTKKIVVVPTKTISNKTEKMIVNYIKVPLFGDNGEVWGILGAIEDETEYLRVQSALNLSEKRYQGLVENISDFVWEIDDQNKFTHVSPRVTDLLGFNPEDIFGKQIFSLMENNQQPEDKEKLERLINEKKEIKQFENRLVSKNGHNVFVETNAMPVYDDNGVFRGYLGADRDISRRKEAEKSLQEAFEKEKQLNDMRRHFVTMTSHEFRTPISAILSSAELLEYYSEKWEPEKRMEHYKKIQLFSHRLADMLSEIMTYGRLNVNKPPFPLQKLDIVQLSENVISEIKAADNYQHSIYLVMNGENHELLCDGNEFKVILINLLSNAIKYSRPNTEIIVSLDKTQEDYILQVIDKGFGIDQNEIEDIFEPFCRGIKVSGIPGTGLGLTIVQKTVELLNGRIEVQSQPGDGSTFSVYLPIVKANK